MKLRKTNDYEMIEEKDIIRCGKFFRTHALKGELNAMTDGVDADVLGEGYPVIVEMDGIPVPFYVESFRPKGTFGCLVKLEGIDTVERASEFVNKEFSLFRKDLAEYLGVCEDELEDEDDYVGWRVEVEGFGYVGRVSDIDTSTPNWLLIVTPDDEDDDDIFIPFNEDFIKGLEEYDDPERNTLVLDLPEGLLDLNRKQL